MGLESVTHIGDLVVTNPVFNDTKREGDDHIRAIKTGLRNSLPNADRAYYFPRSVNKTGNYTVLSTDLEKHITVDTSGGAVSLTLPSLGASNDGWTIWVTKTTSDANAVTVVGTVNGSANPTVGSQYEHVKVWWNGSAWYMLRVPLIPIGLTNVNITGGTALTAPAVDDELAIYDLSATANRKITLLNLLKVVAALTAETGIAVDDELLLYDLSETAANKITIANLLKVINALTADSTPDHTADYVPVYDASASDVKKVLLTRLSKGWEFIASVTASSSSELDFTSTDYPPAFDGSLYDRLMVKFDLVPATDSAVLHHRVRSSGAWQTANYAYGYLGTLIATAGIDNSQTGQAQGIISSNVGNAAGEHVTGTLEVVNPESTNRYLAKFNCEGLNASSIAFFINGVVNFASNSAIDGLRFYFSSGNIASGNAALYGLKKV